MADHPLQINASPYAYTGNNPISRVDPDGNCWPCLVVVIEALTVSELVAAGGAIIGTAVVMNSMNQFKNSNNSSYSVQDGTKGPKVVLTPVAQSKESNIKKESVVNGVKAKLAPDKDAGGDHSAFKTDKDGKTTGTATYEKNPQNPSGFDEVKRVDVTGKPHYDKKTGKEIPTPHVKEGRDVRPARKDEIPKQ